MKNPFRVVVPTLLLCVLACGFQMAGYYIDGTTNLHTETEYAKTTNIQYVVTNQTTNVVVGYWTNYVPVDTGDPAITNIFTEEIIPIIEVRNVTVTNSEGKVVFLYVTNQIEVVSLLTVTNQFGEVVYVTTTNTYYEILYTNDWVGFRMRAYARDDGTWIWRERPQYDDLKGLKSTKAIILYNIHLGSNYFRLRDTNYMFRRADLTE